MCIINFNSPNTLLKWYADLLTEQNHFVEKIINIAFLFHKEIENNRKCPVFINTFHDKLIGKHYLGFFLPDWLSQMPLYLWLLVFWTRPHKEERFLFPIYPLICLAGAMVIDSVQKLWFYLFVPIKSKHFLSHTTWLGIAAVATSALISLSRITALYQVNYNCNRKLQYHFKSKNKRDCLCICG